MAAIPTSVPNPVAQSRQSSDTGPNGFLQYLPAVRRHAEFSFRGRKSEDREECIAEAIASAYVNYHSACRRGRSAAIRPSMLAWFAVQHVNAFRNVGGSQENKNDVLSRQAQRLHGFDVERLPEDQVYDFDILKIPDQQVWRLSLRHDARTDIPSQIAFRIDWSRFMSKQHDRTRTAIGLLASGDRRCEVADKLGTTPSAVTQRMAKAKREWQAFQGENPENSQRIGKDAARNGDNKCAGQRRRYR